MRIYLDACCLSRPFDNLDIDRNRLEADAVLIILRHIEEGIWRLVGSNALQAEISHMPPSEKREMTQAFLVMCEEMVQVTAREEARMEVFVNSGIRPFDAIHLACAESAKCDVFLTVDDQLLRKGQTLKNELAILVENPLQWIMEQITS